MSDHAALGGGSSQVADWMSEAEAADDNTRWSALMARAQVGDEQAYHALLGELARVIRRFLLSRFGYYDQVDDCVQECLLAIHAARHTYDSRRDFKPWLFAIVRHKAVDHLRRQRRQRRHTLEAVPEDDLAVSSLAMENQVTQGQLIADLAPDYREAITLTKIVGLSSAEAAARLNISESALKVRVHRALRRLRRMLEAEPND